MKSFILVSAFCLFSACAFAQSSTVIKAIDPSARTTTDVGDTGNHALRINCILGCSASSLGQTDNVTFNLGSSVFTPGGGTFQTTVTSLSSGVAAAFRITAQRALHINLRDNAGVEMGVSANPLFVTGPTLTSLDTKTPALGQAAMAASQPVVIANDQSPVPIIGPDSQIVTGMITSTTCPGSGCVELTSVGSSSGSAYIELIPTGLGLFDTFFIEGGATNVVVQSLIPLSSPFSVNGPVIYYVPGYPYLRVRGNVVSSGSLAVRIASRAIGYAPNTVSITPGSTIDIGSVFNPVNVSQGNGTFLTSAAWWTKIGDGSNGPVAVTPASTDAAATDPALVTRTVQLPLALATNGGLKIEGVAGGVAIQTTGPLTDTQLRASAVPVSLASTPTTAVTNAGLTNLDVALSTRTKPADQQHAIIDSGTTVVTQPTGSNLHVACDSGCSAGAPGQTTMALSSPVVIASNQSAVPVTLASTTITGNVAVTNAGLSNIPAQGQALAAASLPVVLPAAQITTLTPPAAITGFALEAGHLATIDTKMPALGQALAAASVPVILPSATITTLTPPAAITGFALEAGHLAAIDTATARIPAVGQTTMAASQPVVIANNQSAIPVTLATAPALVASSAVIGHVIVDTTSTTAVTQATPANLNATVTPIALTKGTQGATGFTTQDLKDAGRTLVTFTADNVVPVLTTDTLVTFSKLVGDTVTAGVTTYPVTSGKTLRITGLTISMVATSTTPATIRVRLRTLTTSPCIATSPVVGVWMVASPIAVPAAQAAGAALNVSLPDGMEFTGATRNLCLSMNALGAAAQTVTITVTGFEY